MPTAPKRFLLLATVAAVFVLALYHLSSWDNYTFTDFPGTTSQSKNEISLWPPPAGVPFHWDRRSQNFPVEQMIRLPKVKSIPNIPKIQYDFTKRIETTEEKSIREMRLKSVHENFVHTWTGYQKYAWAESEVLPVSGGKKSSFGGWGATLVDSLDTLWILGLKKEFAEAVAEVTKIDFTTTDAGVISVFETTIRYLGGLLAAYDLSGNKILLRKARELGDMLYTAFDTPNRMPVSLLPMRAAAMGEDLVASRSIGTAEVGSLSLEFTRLAQLTGQDKYFDAVQRVSDLFLRYQNETRMPGMWPISMNAGDGNFNGDHSFSLGASADSLYEYFPKEYLLLGGQRPEYITLYTKAIEAAKKNLFFRPMTPENLDILISGDASVTGFSFLQVNQQPFGQHLACFVGGMVGIGAKIFKREDEVSIARKLTDGCIWTYNSMGSGVGPESFQPLACPDTGSCAWNETAWTTALNRTHHINRAFQSSLNMSLADFAKQERIPRGFVDITDRRYLLRPEAIESVFILYRITGDRTLQDHAWKMWEAVSKHTRTEIAHAALEDVSKEEPGRLDNMESFWPAETLKYFYLIFSEPGVISLDEWVLNTEAHPLKRPKEGGSWWW